MAFQKLVNADAPVAVPGSSASPRKEIGVGGPLSFLAKAVAPPIAGNFCFLEPDGVTVTSASAAPTLPLGVAVDSHVSNKILPFDGTLNFAPGDGVNVQMSGAVWVTNRDVAAMVPNEIIYFLYADGAAVKSTTALAVISKWMAVTGADPGQPVLIQFVGHQVAAVREIPRVPDRGHDDPAVQMRVKPRA